MTQDSIRERALRYLDEGRSELSEADIRDWLGGVLPFGSATDCRSVEDAVAASRSFHAPVVLKLISTHALHKTELGFVRLGLHGPISVAKAARDLLERAARLGFDDARLSLQAQLEGIELAFGISRDALGAICLVGAGGIHVEVLDDTQIGIAPLDADEARSMLARLRISPLLDGVRGQAASDRGALCDLLVRVSHIAIEVPELSELDLNPVFATPGGCAIADARGFLRRPETPVTLPPPADIDSLLSPRRIAIIGGTSEPAKIGSMMIHYLDRHRFPGDVVNVSLNERTATSVPLFRSIKEAGAVDLACIAVQADAVEHVLRECVEAGVPYAIVYSAGFAESGADGAGAQARLVEATRGKLRFVGPNSIGIIAPRQRLFASFGMALEADHLTDGLADETVALVSQSGAMASSLFSRSREFSLDFGCLVSVGNEADLGIADFVSYLADDPHCSVICLFLEVVRRPEEFAAAAAKATAAGKALIAVKAGSSEAGRLAAASHTGALTGSDDVYSAYFDRLGVIRVLDLRTMLAGAQGVLTCGPVHGRRVAIVSMSGGVSSLVSDACATAGLEIPRFGVELQERLQKIVPSYGNVTNPVDVTAGGIQDPSMIARTMSEILDSDSVDIVLLQLSTNADPGAYAMALDLVALRERYQMPFLVGRLGSPAIAPEGLKVFEAANVHVFSWPDELVAAASAAVKFGLISQRGARTRVESSMNPSTDDLSGAK